MVSIVERNSYLSELRSNPKLELLFSLVFFKPPNSEFETTVDVDKVYKNTIFSIVENDKDKFAKWYEKISARQPNEYSPFTNDDLLLFVLIVGVLKFDGNPEWVKNILGIRKNTDDEKSLITTTFKNIINGNFKSSDNAFQIVFVIQDLVGEELITWTEKKNLYTQLATADFPMYKSELLNITSIKAFDSVILEGDKSDESNYSQLKKFELKFCSRAKLMGQTLHVLSVIGLYVGFFYWYFFNIQLQNFIKPYLGFMNFLGFGGLSAMIFFRNKIGLFYEKLIKRFWGYKKDI